MAKKNQQRFIYFPFEDDGETREMGSGGSGWFSHISFNVRKQFWDCGRMCKRGIADSSEQITGFWPRGGVDRVILFFVEVKRGLNAEGAEKEHRVR
jgi:hypothetical protein